MSLGKLFNPDKGMHQRVLTTQKSSLLTPIRHKLLKALSQNIDVVLKINPVFRMAIFGILMTPRQEKEWALSTGLCREAPLNWYMLRTLPLFQNPMKIFRIFLLNSAEIVQIDGIRTVLSHTH